MEHAGPFWTERVKIVLDGTNSAHLISESATVKATLALPLNLALPIAKLKFRFGPNKVYSERPPFGVKRQRRNMVYGLRAQSPKYVWDQGSEERAQGSEEWDQGSQRF